MSEAQITKSKTRIRVYMNLDADIPTIAASEGAQGAANARKRELAQQWLAEVLGSNNPEFHSVRLVRSK